MVPSCLIGGAAALLIPTTSAMNYWIITFQYFIYHIMIIVFAINTQDLDTRKLMQDPNIRDMESYIYQGIIPAEKLYIITETKGLVGRLSEIKRVPAYYR